MWIDALITGGVVTGAVAYLVWRFLPKGKPSGCSGCPTRTQVGRAERARG